MEELWTPITLHAACPISSRQRIPQSACRFLLSSSASSFVCHASLLSPLVIFCPARLVLRSRFRQLWPILSQFLCATSCCPDSEKSMIQKMAKNKLLWVSIVFMVFANQPGSTSPSTHWDKSWKSWKPWTPNILVLKLKILDMRRY